MAKRIALLGADSDSTTLVAAARSAGFDVVWACPAGCTQDDLRTLVPRAVLADDWQSLMAGDVADVVLVARGNDPQVTAEQLRRLFQARVPVLAAHPLHDSMLVYYELEMIRRETACPALVYLPARWHPAVQELAALLDGSQGGSFGPVEQVHFERALGARGRGAALACFARDADLLRALFGELTRVAAFGPSPGAASYGNLAVQLSGPTGVVLRWSVVPQEQEAGSRLLVRCARGRACLRMPPAGEPWTLQTALEGDERLRDYPGWSAESAAWEKLRGALDGESVRPDWSDAARSVELAEAIDRSLARGRTVELHYDDYTEQATFKGTMTTLGCGLLTVAVAVTLLAAVLARSGLMPWAGRWPLVLLGVLVVFLLLQLLQLVFAREKAVGEAARERSPAS